MVCVYSLALAYQVTSAVWRLAGGLPSESELQIPGLDQSVSEWTPGVRPA
jgi:hypothetical protein